MMIYAFLGFLEAGKTSIIKDLLKQDLFDRKLKTLIVCCEEGEEEYDPVFLANVGATVAYIEDEKSFSGDGILSQLKKYKPDRIFVEYNGMWRATKIIEFYQDICEILFDRQVMIQTLDIVNDETFSVYMKNMPSLMTEHFKVSETIICNRCTVEKTNKSAVRGSVKAVNPRAQLVFESEDEEFYKMKEVMPFDKEADVIDITNENFGLWYIDMIENVKDYEGKTIKIRGICQKPKGLTPGFAVLGRRVMTCCADDIQFMGFMVKYDNWDDFKNQDFIAITARMEYKYMKEYQEEGPVFYADLVEKEERPEDDLVYFN